jgi:hypothetical protein
MRPLALSLALLSLAVLPAAAETRRQPSPAQQAQQERMRQCSATAKQQGLRADPRKAFMKECLARRAAG